MGISGSTLILSCWPFGDARDLFVRVGRAFFDSLVVPVGMTFGEHGGSGEWRTIQGSLTPTPPFNPPPFPAEEPLPGTDFSTLAHPEGALNWRESREAIRQDWLHWVEDRANFNPCLECWGATWLEYAMDDSSASGWILLERIRGRSPGVRVPILELLAYCEGATAHLYLGWASHAWSEYQAHPSDATPDGEWPLKTGLDLEAAHRNAARLARCCVAFFDQHPGGDYRWELDDNGQLPDLGTLVRAEVTRLLGPEGRVGNCSELRPEPPDTEDMAAIMRHARSFDAYRYYGGYEEAAAVDRRMREQFQRTGHWAGTLEELLCSLFMWQRALAHAGSSFLSPKEQQEIRSLYRAIRTEWERRGHV